MGYFYGYGPSGYWSYFYILFIAVAVFSIWAQIKVNSTFKKYSKVPAGRTGRQAAEMVLRANGVAGVSFGTVSGSLTDHYDPRKKLINLSDDVNDSASVAAIGVAAHEAGHAVQDAVKYPMLRFRNAIVKTTGIVSRLAMPLIFIGIILMAVENASSSAGFFIANIGIVAFSAVAFFQLVTLPVEFNASRRAVATLSESGIMDDDEIRGVKRVLTAAALTYVAALAAALVNLLRVILLVNSSRRNDR